MWHAQGRREMHREFWLGNLKKRDHFEYPGIDVGQYFKGF